MRSELHTVLLTDDLVRRAWCAALDVERAEPDDDFFTLGGNSLLAITMLEAIERDVGVPVPFEALFIDGTFASVRDSVAGAVAEAGRVGA